MTPFDRVLAALKGVRRSGKGWVARCPAHDDRNPSLSIFEGDDGSAVLKCHAGCVRKAILAAVGLTARDLIPGPGQARPSQAGPRTYPTANAAVQALETKFGSRSAEWVYHDAAGQPVGLVVRWDKPDGSKRKIFLWPGTGTVG